MPKKGRAFRPAPVNWVCTPSWFFFGAANYKRKFVINLWCYTKRLVYTQSLRTFKWYSKRTRLCMKLI